MLNDLPDDVAARLGPKGENIYDMVLRQQILNGEAIDPEMLGMVMADPALESIFKKVAAVENGEAHQPLTASELLKEQTTFKEPKDIPDDVNELEPIIVIAGAYSPSLKEQAFNVLGDAKEFADTLPQEKVGLGMLVLGAVTGRPIKLAFNQGLDMVTGAVIGGSVQAVKDDISKWLAGWSFDLNAEHGGRPISAIEEWLATPEIREDAQHQIDGASFGLELFGAAFGAFGQNDSVTTKNSWNISGRDGIANVSQPITDPSRLLPDPRIDKRTGEIDENYRPAEDPNHQISSFPAPDGMRIHMAVDASQIDPKTGQVSKPGGFAALEEIKSLDEIRGPYAVKPSFKEAVTHTQEFEVKKGAQIQSSIVGPQIDSEGKIYIGGKPQVEILVPRDQRTNVLVPIGLAKPLPQ